jgi:hypothetical protein
LEEIARWQKKCEERYGFDPINYFGDSLRGIKLSSKTADSFFEQMFEGAKTLSPARDSPQGAIII